MEVAQIARPHEEHFDVIDLSDLVQAREGRDVLDDDDGAEPPEGIH